MTFGISSRMNPATWEDPRDILAEQLASGRLTLVLGAGVSVGFGLPQWSELTDRAVKLSECTVDTTALTPEEIAEEIFHKCGTEQEFGRVIRAALYETYDSSLSKLTSNRLLTAIGALTMASTRGQVAQVISYNFDDLLERFLEYHGFMLESIGAAYNWASKVDIHLYHPHGILPSDLKTPVTYPPVLARIQYDRIVGKSTNAWRNLLIQIMSSGTCLFLGLSGKDTNLSSTIYDVSKIHPGMSDGDAYWGVRISDKDSDPLKNMWMGRKVCQYTIPHYDLLPEVLLEICQRAVALVKVRHLGM
jgi:hypothetical protein